eukprot:GDKJ01030089.1.p1 GENE.GDKJ01030089.1~~GDKJ01030089.1.p1  ORF type:complete len:888 (-),score=252.14 GDKJ01030089.1:253-2847(-)
METEESALTERLEVQKQEVNVQEVDAQEEFDFKSNANSTQEVFVLGKENESTNKEENRDSQEEFDESECVIDLENLELFEQDLFGPSQEQILLEATPPPLSASLSSTHVNYALFSKSEEFPAKEEEEKVVNEEVLSLMHVSESSRLAKLLTPLPFMLPNATQTSQNVCLPAASPVCIASSEIRVPVEVNREKSCSSTFVLSNDFPDSTCGSLSSTLNNLNCSSPLHTSMLNEERSALSLPSEIFNKRPDLSCTSINSKGVIRVKLRSKETKQSSQLNIVENVAKEQDKIGDIGNPITANAACVFSPPPQKERASSQAAPPISSLVSSPARTMTDCGASLVDAADSLLHSSANLQVSGNSSIENEKFARSNEKNVEIGCPLKTQLLLPCSSPFVKDKERRTIERSKSSLLKSCFTLVPSLVDAPIPPDSSSSPLHSLVSDPTLNKSLSKKTLQKSLPPTSHSPQSTPSIPLLSLSAAKSIGPLTAITKRFEPSRSLSKLAPLNRSASCSEQPCSVPALSSSVSSRSPLQLSHSDLLSSIHSTSAASQPSDDKITMDVPHAPLKTLNRITSSSQIAFGSHSSFKATSMGSRISSKDLSAMMQMTVEDSAAQASMQGKKEKSQFKSKNKKVNSSKNIEQMDKEILDVLNGFSTDEQPAARSFDELQHQNQSAMFSSKRKEENFQLQLEDEFQFLKAIKQKYRGINEMADDLSSNAFSSSAFDLSDGVVDSLRDVGGRQVDSLAAPASNFASLFILDGDVKHSSGEDRKEIEDDRLLEQKPPRCSPSSSSSSHLERIASSLKGFAASSFDEKMNRCLSASTSLSRITDLKQTNNKNVKQALGRHKKFQKTPKAILRQPQTIPAVEWKD